MVKKEELKDFKKMWSWLTGYPAHDREYYMKNVAKLDEMWLNSCPLSNNRRTSDCNGCETLWSSDEGTLCTDPNAPIFKWQHTELQHPDNRSFYASQVAVLAIKLSQNLGHRCEHFEQRKSSVQ